MRSSPTLSLIAFLECYECATVAEQHRCGSRYGRCRCVQTLDDGMAVGQMDAMSAGPFSPAEAMETRNGQHIPLSPMKSAFS
ncbi:hypothetical protein TcWFU_008417 [Taenia crassiceps]|uniref:Secreted protein n=1 Tax=Taenia crassiceps TaxID=6207 RepID=A0ABR4PZJ7_9CEST